jgi:hypothetical protein
MYLALGSIFGKTLVRDAAASTVGAGPASVCDELAGTAAAPLVLVPVLVLLDLLPQPPTSARIVAVQPAKMVRRAQATVTAVLLPPEMT